MCLRIASQALTSPLGFCDYSKNNDQVGFSAARQTSGGNVPDEFYVIGCVVFQVLSGGVVLQLTAGQKVWLESFRDQQTNADSRDIQDKQIIFNGFLISSDS